MRPVAACAQDLGCFRPRLRGGRAISDMERGSASETERGVRRHTVARRHPLPRVILHYPMRLVGGHVELVARVGSSLVSADVVV